MLNYLKELLQDIKLDKDYQNRKQKILSLETAIDILESLRNKKEV